MKLPTVYERIEGMWNERYDGDPNNKVYIDWDLLMSKHICPWCKMEWGERNPYRTCPQCGYDPVAIGEDLAVWVVHLNELKLPESEPL